MARHRDREQPGAGQRQLRVGELVRHALSEMLIRADVHDPVLAAHTVTVPEVRMSPDLRLATIYVMPLGGRDIEAVLEALERNKRFLRGEIARDFGRAQQPLDARRLVEALVDHETDIGGEL